MAITRRKTEEVRTCPHSGSEMPVWDILLDGVVIGQTFAVRPTETQRRWNITLTVGGETRNIEGGFSIAQAVPALYEEMVAATAIVDADDATATDDATGTNLEIVETDEATA